ncbi:hypothetical protein B6K85_26410 [Vibrio sp. V1B]|uniref:hypothetical protein n=1 Tax=Vibrio sp. V1B TaxID=2047825 RepID=UPI000BAEC1B9|nr:hypothetical protein [Vibrio sp. V1B]PAW07662.1 hypothetical protein B6K85_26410 [Vibrio sp. V1B]
MENSNNFKLIWWLILVVALGLFLFMRSSSLLSGEQTYFDVVVFLVWVSLALAPIFKETKIFGLHLKKDIEELKKDLSHQIMVTKLELSNSIATTSTASNHVQITTPSPASDDQLPIVKEQVRSVLAELGVSQSSHNDLTEIYAKNAQPYTDKLFQTRYLFEKLLSDFGFSSKRSPAATLRALEQEGIISKNLMSSVIEILHISNYAIHAHDLSKAQVELVDSSASDLYKALKRTLEENA